MALFQFAMTLAVEAEDFFSGRDVAETTVGELLSYWPFEPGGVGVVYGLTLGLSPELRKALEGPIFSALPTIEAVEVDE